MIRLDMREQEDTDLDGTPLLSDMRRALRMAGISGRSLTAHVGRALRSQPGHLRQM